MGRLLPCGLEPSNITMNHIFNFATRASSIGTLSSNIIMNSVYLFRLSSTPGALAGSSTLTIGFYDTTDTFVERRYHH